MTTPNRAQIVESIKAHPGISTTSLVELYEDPSDKLRFKRAYCCVWHKLIDLADRGEIVRLNDGARKDGQRWAVPESRGAS